MPRTIRLDGLGQLLEKQSSVVSGALDRGLTGPPLPIRTIPSSQTIR